MTIDAENYRRRLIEERDRLTGDVGTVADVVPPVPDDRHITAADAQLPGEVIDIQAEVVDLKSRRLEQINAALDSINDGTFGVCKVCGKEINPKRLDADPAVLTCVEDQAAAEGDIETPDF